MKTIQSHFVLVSTLCGSLALGACAVGPDFRAPDAPQVKSLTAQPLPAETVATAGAQGGAAQSLQAGADIPAQWWQLFQSPKLDELIRQALAANPTVASAQASLRNAQENLRMAREIQFTMLPQTYPVFPNGAPEEQSAFRFAHHYQPAESVSGDFFSVTQLSDYER